MLRESVAAARRGGEEDGRLGDLETGRSARALGLAHEVGTIEAGKAAPKP